MDKKFDKDFLDNKRGLGAYEETIDDAVDESSVMDGAEMENREVFFYLDGCEVGRE